MVTNVCHSNWKTLRPSSDGSSSRSPADTTTMSPADTTASHPIRLIVPRDIVLSNQYRSRARRSVPRAIRRVSLQITAHLCRGLRLRAVTVVVLATRANA